MDKQLEYMENRKKVSVLMVGTGGYAGLYVKELLHGPNTGRFEIVGAVDPYAGQSESGRELIRCGVPVYHTVEEFYREKAAQLAFIVTPIYLHASQTQYCMEHGSDVLCEKPICATLADAKAMMAVRDRVGRRLAIGFQWSFNKSILQLKQDIKKGLYGKIRRFRTLVFFPRTLNYYRRGTGWAGKRRLETGEWLLDSVASNAAAHYLHNMLFLTGKEMERSAEPVKIEAEVYRANPIEMFDTCALRIFTADDAELLFYATHAVPQEQERSPEFIIEGELGTVTLRYEAGREIMTGTLADGRSILYGAPSEDNMRKLSCMADAVLENAALPCIPETALPHLKCVCALAESFPETPEFPEEFVCYDENTCQYTCKGLGEALNQCWERGNLPYEADICWAQEPRVTMLRESEI